MKIEQGATLNLTLTFKDSDGAVIDKSSYTFAAMIREDYDSPKIIDLTIDETNKASGIIVLSLTATQTAALNFNTGVWDLESTTGSTIAREIQGKVELSKEVTK